MSIVLCSGLIASPARAQQSQGQQQSPDQKNQQNSSPEAGGPQGDIGPIAVPKKGEPQPKKDDTPPPASTKNLPNFSMHVNVPLVTLDVGVLNSKTGEFMPGIGEQYFRVFEDGKPQTISNFSQTQAPITAVMLVEFANNFYPMMYDSLEASYTFTSTLKKDDWIALIAYDMRPHILQDFTQNKQQILGGLDMMRIATSQETNLFDALYDTIDRLEGVQGHKYIILISSGHDTFSKRNLDQVIKKIKGAKDITIFAVGTGQAMREYAEVNHFTYALCDITERDVCNMVYLQADNQMRTFAKLSGGKAYFPMFEGQFRDIWGDIAQTIRNKYSISYHPSNQAEDGSYRKLKVELVGPDGKPLKIMDEKGKPIKYQIIAREGYTAKREVE